MSYSDNDSSGRNVNKNSPLYTSDSEFAKKQRIVKELGKDKDGAFRAYNRLDKKKSDKY